MMEKRKRFVKNFIDLGCCKFGFRQLVVYLDTDEYLGVGPLKKHKVRIKDAVAMAKEDEQYELIVLKVVRKDMDAFRAAMEDLKTKMLICGHRDYETHGAEVIGNLEDFFRRELKEKGKIPSPLGGKIRPELG